LGVIVLLHSDLVSLFCPSVHQFASELKREQVERDLLRSIEVSNPTKPIRPIKINIKTQKMAGPLEASLLTINRSPNI